MTSLPLLAEHLAGIAVDLILVLVPVPAELQLIAVGHSILIVQLTGRVAQIPPGATHIVTDGRPGGILPDELRGIGGAPGEGMVSVMDLVTAFILML